MKCCEGLEVNLLFSSQGCSVLAHFCSHIVTRPYLFLDLVKDASILIEQNLKTFSSD